VGNFIDQALASSLNIRSYPLSSQFPVQALDNKPRGSGTMTHITAPLPITVALQHQEPFLIIQAPVHKVVLGLPWIPLHDPTICWSMPFFKINTQVYIFKPAYLVNIAC
jgi:hypothetical protein